jgi:predicted alpha/beta superfamily hydrolase
VSPSVWWADKFVVHQVEALRRKPGERIWLDVGTREGRDTAEGEKTVTDTRLLRDMLVRKGWSLGKDLKYLEAAGAEHNERAWAARVEGILEFLFPKK